MVLLNHEESEKTSTFTYLIAQTITATIKHTGPKNYTKVC